MDALKRVQTFGTRLPWQPDLAIDSHRTYNIIVPLSSVCHISRLIEITQPAAEILQFKCVDDGQRMPATLQASPEPLTQVG